MGSKFDIKNFSEIFQKFPSLSGSPNLGLDTFTSKNGPIKFFAKKKFDVKFVQVSLLDKWQSLIKGGRNEGLTKYVTPSLNQSGNFPKFLVALWTVVFSVGFLQNQEEKKLELYR